MAGPLQYGYDTNYKPQGMLAGWLAGERDNELGLSRLMQQYSAAQELESQKYQNQVSQASVPAKQSEFLLQTLMNDTARNTPDYAQTIAQGTMDEARNKGELYKKSKVANEETAKDIAEADALQGLDNAIQSFTLNPDNPAGLPQAMDALKKLGIPTEGAMQIIEAGRQSGKSPAEILKAVRDQFVEFKARSPKFMEKSLIQTQKDTAEMARVKEKMLGAVEVAKIRAAVQKAIAQSKGDKLNLDQLIAADLQRLYPDPIERLYATQMAQQFKGEVAKYSNSGMVLNKDEKGNTVIGQPTAPTPNLGRQGMTPKQAADVAASPARVEIRGETKQEPPKPVSPTQLGDTEAKSIYGSSWSKDKTYYRDANGQYFSSTKKAN